EGCDESMVVGDGDTVAPRKRSNAKPHRHKSHVKVVRKEFAHETDSRLGCVFLVTNVPFERAPARQPYRAHRSRSAARVRVVRVTTLAALASQNQIVAAQLHRWRVGRHWAVPVMGVELWPDNDHDFSVLRRLGV